MVLTRLALPPGAVSCCIVLGAGKVGGKQDKGRTLAGTPRMQGKKRKSAVLGPAVEPQKIPWEGKLARDGAAVASSKRRADTSHNRRTKRARTAGDAGGQSAPRPPVHF